MNKKEIRKYISEKKQCMSEAEIAAFSQELTERFCALPQFREADCLYAYISFNQEVRTHQIIERAIAAGKKVAVPKVVGEDLVFRYIESTDLCEEGFYGIPEPREHHEIADGKDPQVLMLMPGLAFDPTGARVGYGKGFYDRYLSCHPEVQFTKIALCYDFQLLDYIEAEPHDVRADLVLHAPVE